MLVVSTFCYTQTIFINEIHYDNDGADLDEGVEIAGPAGTDLTGYKVYLYNGNDSKEYGTISLSGIIPNQLNNRGVLWFTKTDIQNGAPDGLALVDNLDDVIQFLSYEGVITAVDGPAIGLTSIDIGVSEPGAIGESLQLIGSGLDYTDFTWYGPVTDSPGNLNSNQTLSVVENQIEGFLMYPNPIKNGILYISSSNKFNVKVEIYTMLGKCIFSKKTQIDETIDVSNLISGIYMVRVEEEERITTRKLIIK